MAIYISKSPSAGDDLVRNHLTMRRESLKHLRWAGGELPVGPAYYIYTVTREDLLSGRFLQKAWPTAWLYVVGPRRDPQGLAEVACADRSKNPAPLEYATLHSADVAKELLKRIAAAEALIGGGYDEYYELRLLRAPSLSLFAVWMLGDDGQMFLPVQAPRAVMRQLEGRLYLRQQELEQALLPLAAHRSRVSDRG